MKCHIVLTVVVLAKICFISGGKVPMDRDKRTLDTVLRGLADAFGYDIQKRPSLLQTAPTTPAPRVSTFPPPLKPLPPAPKPAIFDLLTPRAALPTVPAGILPLPPPRKAPAIRPRIPSVAPLPSLPRVPLTAPKAPPPPPPLPPVPARTPQAPPKSPPVVPRASPPKPAASMQPPPPPPGPSGLTESFQKTFNLNFNWNKNVMPITAGTPAAGPSKAPPPRVAPVAPPPPAPAAAPKPAPPPPPPPLPSVITRPGGQQFIHKPQLYQDYDYANLEDAPEQLIIYEDDEAAVNPENNNLQLTQEQLDYNYPEYQQVVNQDYSEVENSNSKERQVPEDPAFSREKFKKSVNEFWQNYPLSEQHGYKYISEPEPHQPDVSNPTNFPRGFSKYEEYDIKPAKKMKKVNYKKTKTKPAPKGNDYEDDKEYTRIYLIPKDYLDEQVQYEPESEEKPEVAEETIAHTRYLGVATPQLHQLASNEGESKPWSIPFDYDLSSSEIKNRVVEINRTNEKLGVTPEEEKCCFRETSSGDFDFYTVPEPESMDYGKLEKLYTDEDDGGLSKNAKIQTNEKLVSVLNTNKFENPLKW